MEYGEKTADRLIVGDSFIDRFGYQGSEGSVRTDVNEFLTGRPNTFPAVAASHTVFDVIHAEKVDGGQVLLINPAGQYLYLPRKTNVTVCSSPSRRAYIASVRGWGKLRYRLGKVRHGH